MLSAALVRFDGTLVLGVLLYAAAAVPALREGSMPASAMAASLGLGAGLVTASAIDLHTFVLPNRLTMPIIVSGLAVNMWPSGSALLWSIGSAVLGYGLLWTTNRLYQAMRGRQGVGMGDAKLLAGAGAWLGAQSLPTVLLWATALALVSAAGLVLAGRQIKPGTRLPFGPALAAGFWLTWLYGAIG